MGNLPIDRLGHGMPPLSESELLTGYGVSPDDPHYLEAGVLLTPVPEVVAAIDAIAREVATIRELCELLVDWAGARDRVPADEPPTHYPGPHGDCIATVPHYHDRPYRPGEWSADSPDPEP